MTPPSAASEAAAACAKLAAALPERVRGLKRRGVRPGSPLTAAWGDPAILLQCGGPEPEALQLVDPNNLPVTTTVDGVDWFKQALTRGTRFTATGRVAYVQVDVPEDYTEATDALSDLARAIRAVPVAPVGS